MGYAPFSMAENQSMGCVCLGLFHDRNSCGVKKTPHVTGRSPTLKPSAAEGFGTSAAAVVRCLSCWKIASEDAGQMNALIH